MHSHPLIHAQGFHNTFWAFSNIFHSFACHSVNCEWIVLNFVSDLELSKTEALQVISTWYHYSLIFNHVLKMKSFLNRPIIPALPYLVTKLLQIQQNSKLKSIVLVWTIKANPIRSCYTWRGTSWSTDLWIVDKNYIRVVSDNVLQQNGPNIFCDSIKDFQHTEHINNSKKEPTVVGYSRKESFIEILQLFSKLRRNRKDNFWCGICLVLYQKSKKRLLKLCNHEINIHHQIHY